MPIEIRELVIRTVVSPDAPAPAPSPGSGSTGSAPAPFDAQMLDQLVQDCVRQVLLVLARERDR